jgi:Ca2+-transporting ATPase
MKGLTTAEVAERITSFGYNELPSSRPKSVLRIAGEVMKEPMFMLLVSCGVIYMVLGDYREGIMLLSAILIIIFITFYQYRKTEKALEALKKMSSPRALVIRDEVEIRIPGREVVRDDILLLNEGDRIAADAVLLNSVNLSVDESMLTGESIPVDKSPQEDLASHGGSVYSGTLVVQGKGRARVKATGVNTEFGRIGTSLQQIEEDETRLQKEMKVLIRRLFSIGVFISIAIVLAFYATRGDFLQSLLNGIAASMAILPEEFPVVLTVFLALGSWRLSKKNVLTRKPSAIETLGSATVLCADKTGTITQNKMEVAALYNGDELIYRADIKKNSTLIRDVVTTAQRASPQDSMDPMEKAIRATCMACKFDEPRSRLLKEYALSRELLAMTRVLEEDSGAISVSTKGAPEAIFKLCGMAEAEKSRQFSAVHQMAERGYRVLGVAKASPKSDALPEDQLGFEFQFMGLIGFEDPIRPEVPRAIKECREAGIQVVMITGDFPVTARSIAAQIGLSSGQVITGDELREMTDEELNRKIRYANIFARVVPEQKLRIVQALKANNAIVAMTGDGVNDAPALKAAHIGVSMGGKGTDVAREASSLVLLDDNFASIVLAIRSGRRIYDNLQKAMSYIIAIHIPIIGLTLLPAFMSTLPILLMPLHIVFMELIIDPVCSIAFESEQEEKGIMNRLPRNPSEQFFSPRKLVLSSLQGLLLLAMVLGVYFISLKEGHSEGEVRAIAFSSLIIGNILLILTSLSKTRSFVSVILERNMAVVTILSGAAVLLFCIISIPTFRQVFSFEFPGYQHFVSSIVGAGCVLAVLELVKWWEQRRGPGSVN